MSNGSIFDTKGFEKWIEQIERAEGNVEKYAKQAVDDSVHIFEGELKSACRAANVPNSITSEITSEGAKVEGNRIKARVGWKLSSYDPKNPSPGFKAIFLNYGTPKRSSHGQVAPRHFITTAKKKAKKSIKQKQKDAYNKITGELK